MSPGLLVMSPARPKAAEVTAKVKSEAQRIDLRVFISNSPGYERLISGSLELGSATFRCRLLFQRPLSTLSARLHFKARAKKVTGLERSIKHLRHNCLRKGMAHQQPLSSAD